LLLSIPEFSKQIWISGLHGRPEDVDSVIKNIEVKYPKVGVQLVDLDRVPGSQYLCAAILNALKSFNSRNPIARSLAMETLLFIAANRQINEAVKTVGVSKDTRRTAAIVISASAEESTAAGNFLSEILNLSCDDSLLDTWPEVRISAVRQTFNIGSEELKATKRENEPLVAAIERLAIERSALLTIRK